MCYDKTNIIILKLLDDKENNSVWEGKKAG